jgi:hypothetical protein
MLFRSRTLTVVKAFSCPSLSVPESMSAGARSPRTRAASDSSASRPEMLKPPSYSTRSRSTATLRASGRPSSALARSRQASSYCATMLGACDRSRSRESCSERRLSLREPSGALAIRVATSSLLVATSTAEPPPAKSSGATWPSSQTSSNTMRTRLCESALAIRPRSTPKGAPGGTGTSRTAQTSSARRRVSGERPTDKKKMP